MTENETTSSCGVPEWFGIVVRNDSAAYINEAFVAAVNIPSCAFAFLSNLAIIMTILKTPSLQKPCNTLLCSMAATDCLTGITAQPIFVALRLMLYHDPPICSYQDKLFTAFYASTMLTSGWSFAFLTVVSFDRYCAVSRPLVYHTKVTNKGNMFFHFCVCHLRPRLYVLIYEFYLSCCVSTSLKFNYRVCRAIV